MTPLQRLARHGLVALVVSGVCACAMGDGPAASVDAGSSVTPSECVRGALVLSGGNGGTPHGTFLLSSTTYSSSSSYSASLPAGGSIQFDWSGDPTSGSVAVTGQLVIPGTNEAPPATWCVDMPASLHVTGGFGHLVLTIAERGNAPCSPVGQGAGTNTHMATGCVDVTA